MVKNTYLICTLLNILLLVISEMVFVSEHFSNCEYKYHITHREILKCGNVAVFKSLSCVADFESDMGYVLFIFQ